MIQRSLFPWATGLASKMPSLTIVGPRQSGKTTFCRMAFPDKDYRSLEHLQTQEYAREDPIGFLNQFPEGAILDEIQRAPELTSYLQGIIDDRPTPGGWILSGSQNFSVMEGVSQSLAGRTAILHLHPFERGEIRSFAQFPRTLLESVFTGAYPRVFDKGLKPHEWYPSYLKTYVERDVYTMLGIHNRAAFLTFMRLCAGRVGQLLNLDSLSKDCGVDVRTIKAWLNVLEASFICFRLPPYFGNLRKRLVKSPKLFFFDTGVACSLLGIQTPELLMTHPARGALVENWVVTEILKQREHRGEMGPLCFFRDSNGLEADLLVEGAQETLLLEVKSAETVPKQPFSALRRVQEAIPDDGRKRRLALVYAGDDNQRRTEGDVVGWDSLGDLC